MFARTALISVAFALFFSLAQLASARPLLDFAGDTGVPSVPVETGGQHVLTGSIAQTDQTWSCRGPVDLDSVTVTMTTAISSRRATRSYAGPSAPTPSTSSRAAPAGSGTS